MTTSKPTWATSRSASRAVPTLRTVWAASVRCRMRAERTNWSSSTTSTRAMGGTVRHSGSVPRPRLTPGRRTPACVTGCNGAGRWCSMSRMQRGLVHAAAWTLATGAAVTLSWFGVHTVLSGTAYDAPRALPLSDQVASSKGRTDDGATPRASSTHRPKPPSRSGPPAGDARPPTAPRPTPAGRPAARTVGPAPPGSSAPAPAARSRATPRRAAGWSSTWAAAPPSWCRRRRTRAGRCRCGSRTAGSGSTSPRLRGHTSVFCTWNGHPPTVQTSDDAT